MPKACSSVGAFIFFAMADKKLYYPFTVEPFQEDFNGRLAWSTLGNLILRISSLHAEAHGFGYSYMKAYQRGWVLSRLVLELEHMPVTGEEYRLGTWVNRIYRHFTDRLYDICSSDGRHWGYGTSTWALIDYATRQPVNLETLPDGSFYRALLEENVPIAAVSRTKVQNDHPLLTHIAGYTDLDINGHFNSIRYIDLLLDTFSKRWHESHVVRRIEMAYGLEAYAGETLHVYRQEIDEWRTTFEVRRPAPTVEASETILVRAGIMADSIS